MVIFICCVVGFLVGGIPFGYLLGLSILKDDIRNHGSGNIGATNVARVIGWKWGGLVLFMDAMKGLLPTGAAAWYAANHQAEALHWHLPVATGVCAIIGHMYPVYLKLRGGKGVATALGVVLILAPKAVGVALLVFAAVAGTTRLVALASMLAALAFGIVQLWLMGNGAWKSSQLSLTVFAIAIPLLIIWRHRSNIARMVKGTEVPVAHSNKSSERNDDSPGDVS